MKKQFPAETISCKVKNMAEPNIKPQDSGNLCDCTYATVSDQTTFVTFEEVDKALAKMKHLSMKNAQEHM